MLVIPDSWCLHLHPRRGGRAIPVTADVSAVEQVRERVRLARDRIESILAHAESEPDLVQRIRRYLNGAPDPVGAAVLAEILVVGMDTWQADVFEAFVDAWVIEHGVAFAACAMMELGGVACETIRVRRSERVFGHGWWWEREAARRLRALLATADERDHQAAADSLADHRQTWSRMALVSYLVPTRHDWAEEVWANFGPLNASSEVLLWCTAGTVEQITQLRGRSRLAQTWRLQERLATAIDGVGAAIAPELAKAADEETDADSRGLILEALCMLPTDEAFELLVARLDQRQVLPVLLVAIRRFPVRALRLLAAAASGRSQKTALVTDLLAEQVRAERGVPGPKVKIDGTAGEHVRPLLGDDWADADPRTAAVAAVAAVHKYGNYYAPESRFVEAWIGTHGLAYAACAFTEMCDVQVRPDQARVDVDGLLPTARRLRTMLSATGDQEFQEAVRRLTEHRDTLMRRIVAAYLVPTRQDWVDECCAAPPDDNVGRHMMLCMLGSAEQLDLLDAWATLDYADCSLEILATMAEGVGPAIAPLLAEALDAPDARKPPLDVLAALPSDEAFGLLLEQVDRPRFRPALLEAMRRYPVRAIRMLAQADGAAAGRLLGEHLSADPELVAAVLPCLPAEVRDAVERAVAERVPEARPEALPRLLVEPPWAREEPEKKPVVIEGLTPPTVRSVVWGPGEQQEWLHTGLSYPSAWPMDEPMEEGRVWHSRPTYDKDPGWRRRIEEYRAGRLRGYDEVPIFTLGPEKLIRPLLADWQPRDWDHSSATDRPEEWMRHIVARYELDALPVALRFARSHPARFGPLLIPYLDVKVAELAADCLLWLTREVAVAWFGRHGAEAVRLLLPTALGKPVARRLSAEYALHFLAAEFDIAGAARVHGDEAVRVIEDLLASDSQELVPWVVPRIGKWADPSALPRVLLRGRAHALPATRSGT